MRIIKRLTPKVPTNTVANECERRRQMAMVASTTASGPIAILRRPPGSETTWSSIGRSHLLKVASHVACWSVLKGFAGPCWLNSQKGSTVSSAGPRATRAMMTVPRPRPVHICRPRMRACCLARKAVYTSAATPT